MATLCILAASLLFAVMGVCVKLSSAYFDTAEIVFWRGFIALLLIGGWVLWRRAPLATVHWRHHLWRSLAGTVALLASFLSITLLPLSTAVTLGYSSPLFLAIIIGGWLREPVRRPVYAALLLGFIGLVLLLRPAFAAAQWLGALCGLFCGALSAVAYLNVRMLGRLGEPEWRTVLYFSFANTVLCLPWVLSSTHPQHAWREWLPLVGVGVCGAIAQLCLTAAYKHGKALGTASLSYSTVVFSSLLAWWLWDEQLPGTAYFGILLVIAAGIMASAYSGTRHAR